MSPRFIASSRRRNASIRSGVVDSSSAISPLLCEAFGGSTGLIDVGVVRECHGHAIHHLEDERIPLADEAAGSSRTTFLAVDDEDDSVSKIGANLHLHLELLEGVVPAFPELTKRYCAINSARDPLGPPLVDGVGSKEARYRVKVPARKGLETTAYKLHRVRGRGLLGHRSVSIADRCFRQSSERAQGLA